MAFDTKISQLADAAPLDGTEDLPIVQFGITKRCSTQDIADLGLGFTPENVANKSVNTALGTSDVFYPSQKAVKTYVDAQVSAGLPYKLYCVLLNQVGTGTPTVTVLYNTLTGTPAISRQSAGFYSFTLSGQFPANKTVIPNFILDGSFNDQTFMPIGQQAASVQGYYTFQRTGTGGAEFSIRFFDASFNAAEFSTLFAGTGTLSIEVKVFP